MSFRGRYPTRFRRSDNFQRTKRPFRGRGHTFKRQDGEHNVPPLRGGRGGFKDHFYLREFEPDFQERGRSKGRRPFKNFRGSNIQSSRSRSFKRTKPVKYEQQWGSSTHFESEFRSHSAEKEKFPHDWLEEERYLESRYEEDTFSWRSRSPEESVFNKYEGNAQEQEDSYDRRSRSPLIIHRRFGADDNISREGSFERATSRSFDEISEHHPERILHRKSFERRLNESCERISLRSLERRPELSHTRRSEHSYGGLSPRARSFGSTSNRSFERLTERKFEKHDEKQYDRVSQRSFRRSRSIEERFENSLNKSDKYFGRSTKRFYKKRYRRRSDRSLDRSECSLKSMKRSQKSFEREIGDAFGRSPRDVSFERDKYSQQDVYSIPFSRSVSPNDKTRNHDESRKYFHSHDRSASPRRRPSHESSHHMFDYKEVSLERSLSPVRRSLARQISYERRRNQMLENENRFLGKRSESSIERFLDNCKKSVERKLDASTDISPSSRNDERNTFGVKYNEEKSMTFSDQPRTFRGLDQITFQRGNSLEKTIYNDKESKYFKSKDQPFNKSDTKNKNDQQLSPVSLEGSLGTQEVLLSKKTNFETLDLSPVSQPGSFEKRLFSDNRFNLSPISHTEYSGKREEDDIHVNEDMELSSISQTSSKKRIYSKKTSDVLPGLSPISHTESFEEHKNISDKLCERPKSTDSMQQFLAELERSCDGSHSSDGNSKSPYNDKWKNNIASAEMSTANRYSEISDHQSKGLDFTNRIGYHDEQTVKENNFMLDNGNKRFERGPKTFQDTGYYRDYQHQMNDNDRILTRDMQSYQELNNREIISLKGSWNERDRQLASSMKQNIGNYQGIETTLENQPSQFLGCVLNDSSSYRYPKYQQDGVVHNEAFHPVATNQNIPRPSDSNQCAQYQSFPGLPHPNMSFYQGVPHPTPNFYNHFSSSINLNMANEAADARRFSTHVNNVSQVSSTFNQCFTSKNLQFQPNIVTTTQTSQFESGTTLNKPIWMASGSGDQFPSPFQTNEYAQFNASFNRIPNDFSSINKPGQITNQPLHQGLKNLTEINPSYKWSDKLNQNSYKDNARQNLITLNQEPERQTQNMQSFTSFQQNKTEHVSPEINTKFQLHKDVDRPKKTLPLLSGIGSKGPLTSQSSTVVSPNSVVEQRNVQSKPSINSSPVDIKQYLTGTFAPGYESALKQNLKEVIVISDDDGDNKLCPGVEAVGSISDTPIEPDYSLVEKYKHNPPSYEEMGKILKGFVLFFDVKNDGDLQKDPFVVIQDSFSKSDRFGNLIVEETSQYDSFSSSTRHFCTLRWKGLVLVKTDGCYAEEARRKAGISLINTLAKTCYTIQTKYSYYCGGKLPKLMLKTPEKPGVYKIVRRDEIIKAITETLKELKNQGISSYFAGNKGVDATHIYNVLNFIDSFFKNKNNHTELLFGDPKNEDYTINELKTISGHAESLAWLQWRRVCGFGRGSYTAVSRRFSPQKLLQHLLSLSEDSIRYRLLPPQGPSIDLLMADCQYSPNIIKYKISEKPEAPIYGNQNYQGSQKNDSRQWDSTTTTQLNFKRSWPGRGNRGGRSFNKRGKWC